MDSEKDLQECRYCHAELAGAGLNDWFNSQQCPHCSASLTGLWEPPIPRPDVRAQTPDPRVGQPARGDGQPM